MREYRYMAQEYYDDCYDVYMEIEQLRKSLELNKLKKRDRDLLLQALQVVENLKRI